MDIELVNGFAFVNGEIFTEKYHNISRRDVAKKLVAFDFSFYKSGYYNHEDGYVQDISPAWVIPVGWKGLCNHSQRNRAMNDIIRNGTEEEIEMVKKHYLACLTYNFRDREDLVSFYEDVWSGNERVEIEDHPLLGRREVKPRWLRAIDKRWPKPKKEKEEIGVDPMIAALYGDKMAEKIKKQQQKEEKEKKEQKKEIAFTNQISLFDLNRSEVAGW